MRSSEIARLGQGGFNLVHSRLVDGQRPRRDHSLGCNLEKIDSARRRYVQIQKSARGSEVSLAFRAYQIVIEAVEPALATHLKPPQS
jgi:hypothetical protein